MDSKRLRSVEIKSADRGEVQAVFATYNVVDDDGDVTLPGAFKDGADVAISAYGHGSWPQRGNVPPVGRGTIKTTGTEAMLDGKFFLKTAGGRDAFELVKEMGPLQEWSYGYDILASAPGEVDGKSVQYLQALDVHEVSPVLKGSGVNTRTLGVKEGEPPSMLVKTAVRPHSTPVTNRAWDGAAVVGALPDNASGADLKSVFAWYDASAPDPDGDNYPDAKSAWKFPHHHGIGGPANVQALSLGIAALNGARGGISIPDGDRAGVYAHLAAHLRDADREPPALRDAGSGGEVKFSDELLDFRCVIEEFGERVARVVALRAAKGKRLSQINGEYLEWIAGSLDKLQSQLKDLQSTPAELAAQELARFVAFRQS